MNTQRLEKLIIAWEDAHPAPNELTEFKQLLAVDPAARQRLVESGVMQRIVADRAGATVEADKSERVAFESAEAKRKHPRWPQWRPLAAAAAARRSVARQQWRNIFIAEHDAQGRGIAKTDDGTMIRLRG